MPSAKKIIKWSAKSSMSIGKHVLGYKMGLVMVPQCKEKLFSHFLQFCFASTLKKNLKKWNKITRPYTIRFSSFICILHLWLYYTFQNNIVISSCENIFFACISWDFTSKNNIFFKFYVFYMNFISFLCFFCCIIHAKTTFMLHPFLRYISLWF